MDSLNLYFELTEPLSGKVTTRIELLPPKELSCLLEEIGLFKD